MIFNNTKTFNLLGVLAIIIFTLFIANYSFTSSVDLAHHYALVDNLSKYLGVNNSFGNLGEMAYYPNYTHWLAVISGSFFNSNIFGVSFISILSIVVIWLVISIFILYLKPIVSLLTLMIILIFGLFSSYIGAFYGKEIVGNFFYSQIVAESLAFIVLYIAFILFEKRRILLFLLLFFSMVLAFFHLLPAMQILGVSFLIAFFDIYKTKKIDFLSMGFLIIGSILFLLHPSFIAMQSIGGHNGSLNFPFMPSVTGVDYTILAILFLVSFVISLYFILSKKFISFVSIRLLSFFSLSNSLLMVLQAIALSLNYGSEYAVKKYIFTLITMTVIQISILIAFLINILIEKRYKPEIIIPRIFIASIFTILIITMQFSNNPTYLLKDLTSIEKNLQELKRENIPKNLTDKTIYLDQNNILRYMYSISILEHPRDNFGMKLLSSRNIFNDIISSNISYITAQKNNRYVSYSEIFDVQGYSILNKEKFVSLAEIKIPDIFKENGLKISKVAHVFQAGWNDVEPWGGWSAKNKASLYLKYPINKTFSQFTFVANSWYKDRNVSVFINDIDCGSVLVSRGAAKKYTIQCPIKFENNLRIDFYVEDWNISPKKLKISEDVRNLGIGLQNIKLN